MLKKKLNLFLISNKKNNYKKIILQNYNVNLMHYINITNPNELIAYSSLFKSINLLKKLNKTIFIYQNNYIVILYRNNLIKRNITFKFKNLQVDYFFKIYTFMYVSILINVASNYLKFKSEHEKYLEVFFDCYHNDCTRGKASTMSFKMFLLIMYNLS